MQKPPFKLAVSPAVATAVSSPRVAAAHADGCGFESRVGPDAAHARSRLTDLNPHLHCSVIGTCLSTAELRKLMATHVLVGELSDLDVHHEAVKLAAQGGAVAKSLHKLLDHRHEAVVRRFARVHGEKALTSLWETAWQQGEVPGAYWSVLTHRDTTAALRQRVFGEVHMLSHLVGAANRADIRRLPAIEGENVELRERAERQQLRSQEAFEEKDRAIAMLRQKLAVAEARRATADGTSASSSAGPAGFDELAAAASLVALHTQRRERAEQAAGTAASEAGRLQAELDHLGRHAYALSRELEAAEAQLRDAGESPDAAESLLERQLRNRHVFYVGGRPSSTPAIRDLVLRLGGEFQHHDGGLEDRKGLLGPGVAWAHLVVIPVDCVDHDSATNLKRLCARHEVDFVPLRSASVASFAAGIAAAGSDQSGSPICVRHG